MEFTVGLPGSAPLAEELAGFGIDRDAALIEQRDVDVSRAIQSDTSGVAGHGKGGKELPLRIELLHAHVAEVGHEDMIRFVDGNTDRAMEFPFAGAFLPPSSNEAGRRKFGPGRFVPRRDTARARHGAEQMDGGLDEHFA